MFRQLVFISFLLLLPGLSEIGGKAKAGKAPATLELGPMLGYTGPDEARIWIKASSAAKSGIMVGEAIDMHDGRTIEGPDLTTESEYMGVVVVTGLRPATRYFYKTALDGQVNPDPPFSFVTAPPKGSRTRVRFAFTSCVGDLEKYIEHDKKAIMRAWEALARIPIDLHLRLGDNVYAGSTDPEVLRRIYYWHRRLPTFQKVNAVTPTLAIWDDWDYAADNNSDGTAPGKNDSDGTAPGKERSLRTFKEFWANPSYGETTNPGIYFKFSWGDVDFFMLDVRYHRSPNNSKDEGQKTMLGPAQLRWLKRGLTESRATFKFLVSGSQWHSKGKSDSWRSFMRERNELFQFITDKRIEGVVLLSGDRHLTAGYQIQERFIEITSSPFASENHRPFFNPDEMFMLHDKGNFFVVIEVLPTAAQPNLIFEVHQVGKGIVRRRQLTWQEINGEAQIPTCKLLIDCRN